MINLKKLLVKILTELKLIQDAKKKIKFAQKTWTTTSSSIKDYNTYHPFSYFTATSNNLTNDSDYFIFTTDGIQVKKAGFYYVKIHGHASCTANAAINLQIYLPVENRMPGYAPWYRDIDSRGQFFYEWTGNFAAVENEIITPRIKKYTNDTTSYYRPGYATLEVFYCGSEH